MLYHGQASDEVWTNQLADLVVNQFPVHAGKSVSTQGGGVNYSQHVQNRLNWWWLWLW